MFKKSHLTFIIVILVIGIACVLFGSFFDWQISMGIAKPIIDSMAFGHYLVYEPISMIVEIFGILFSIFIFSSSFLILFIERDENAFNKQRQFIKSFWIWIAVGIYTITFKTFLFESIYNYIFNPTINNVVGSMQLNVWIQIIIYLISFGLAYGTVIFTLKLLKKYQSVFCDRKKEAIKMIIVSIVLLAFVGIMKMSITRERFRAIIFLHTQDMHNYFSVWYKDSAYSHDNIVPAEFNQSFPSGHVLINMNIFLLWFFIPKTNKRNKQITILKTLIIAIPTINCIGRLISGAHYLSDIGWSIIIGVLTILIVQIAFNYTAYKKKIKNRLYD